MKKLSVLFVLMALTVPFLYVSAQGTVEGNVVSTNSIVRVWQEDYMVVYNHVAGRGGTFVLLQNGSLSGQAFNLPTSDAEVLDFEIIEDSVVFCGVYRNAALPGGSCGVVGKFGLMDAFAGSGQVDYALLYSWITYTSNPDEAIYIRNLTRIDVFLDSRYGVVAALLGDAYLYPSTMYDRVAVLSAYKLPSNTWQVYSTFPKDGNMHLTDIAVLDDMVVVAGYGYSGTHCLTKAYHQLHNFPNNPYNTFYYDSIHTNGYTPMYDVLAAKVEGNVMALTQMDSNPSTILHVLEFNSTTGLPQQHTASRVTYSAGCDITTCPWRLDGLRYSPTNGTIHILERGMLPSDLTMNSLLWTYPLTYGGEVTAFVQRLTGLTQASLDVDIAGHPVTSGAVDISGLLDVHTFLPGGTFVPLPYSPIMPADAFLDYCVDNTEDIIDTPTVTIKQRTADNYGPNYTFNNYQFAPEVYEIMFNQICR